MGEFWQIALGSRIGEDAGRNLVAVLDTWAQVDTTFGNWKQFAPKDEATPMALVNRIIIPRVKEWMEGFWEFLRTGKKEPDTKLQEWVEARTMKLEDDDYADMVKATKRLRRGTNVGGDDTADAGGGGRVRSRRRGGRGQRDDGDRRDDRDRGGRGDRGRDDRRDRGGGGWVDKECKWCRYELRLGKPAWSSHNEDRCTRKQAANKRDRDRRDNSPFGDDDRSRPDYKRQHNAHPSNKGMKCFNCGAEGQQGET